jgi:Calcineurin-like phosphoesterase
MAKRPITDFRDLWHSEAQNHWRVQDELYQQENDTNFITGFLKTKVWGWVKHYFKSRFMGKVAYRFYPTNDEDGIYPLLKLENDNTPIVVSLVSDWGSNTQESDDIGKVISDDNPDYTIHLGDVYYVGTPEEIELNFGTHSSWPRGKCGTLAIPGNHEFYSNGKGFYDTLLKYMKAYKENESVGQKAGFFCLENEHWRIIGLDTGYTSVGTVLLEFLFPPKTDLREEQCNWLRDVVKIGNSEDKRGIILLSHHQYYSAFEGNFNRPAKQIAELMGDAQKDILWFWGHEHRIAIHDIHHIDNGIRAYGRCIGHGGMPTEIPTLESPLDVNKALENKLKYYDRQYRIVKDGKKDVYIGNNGYANLVIEGETLKVEHYQTVYDFSKLEGKQLILTEIISKDLEGNISVTYQEPPIGTPLTEVLKP